MTEPGENGAPSAQEESAASAPEAAGAGAPPAAALDDADDLRGHHFRLLLRRPLSRGLLAAGTLAGAALGAALAGLVLALVLAVAALLAGLGIVLAIADSRAADAFFDAYARRRQLSLGGRSRLPAATPLLRKGDDRYAERTLRGPLAAGFEGTVALYTYEVESSDGKGNRQTSYYRYTVGLLELPESVAHLPELYCQRKFGLRSLEKFEDVFRRSKQRLELESELLDDRYEIFAGNGQDAVWLRRLFAPTFIVWLTDSAPPKFAFELVNGTLCCYVGDHQESAAELDALIAATVAVAARLRDEASE